MNNAADGDETDPVLLRRQVGMNAPETEPIPDDVDPANVLAGLT